jgi:hypothetical protein
LLALDRQHIIRAPGYVLKIAESEPRTDDGWTLVQTRAERSLRFGSDQTTKTMCERTKTKVETVNASLISSDCNDEE